LDAKRHKSLRPKLESIASPQLLISQSDNENIEIYKINTGMESKIFSQKKEVRITTRQDGS
jgi:hypothetical protein